MAQPGKCRPGRTQPDLPTLAVVGAMYALLFGNFALHTWRPLPLAAHVLGHNYHAIHHLWPNVPWHRYREVFRERLDLLRKNGVPIEHRVFERRFPARELPAHTPVSG